MTAQDASISRRAFVRQTSALTSLAILGLPASSALAKAPFKMGLQLYTVRDSMAADPIDALRKIAAIGYQDLETYGFDADHSRYYGFAAKELRKVLDDANLTTSSGHYDLFLFFNKPADALRSYVDRCIEGALALNQKYITWPWLDPESRTIDAFKKLAERLNLIGEQISKAGLGLAYHNHEFEFIRHGGESGYDILLRETDPALVKMQLDLFWAAHSSALSPHELFGLQPGRFVMWHLKDMAKNNPDQYTELGNGRIDFTKIMPDASLAGLQYYFVEQGDNFAVDPIQSIAQSARYVREHLE
jgi:sugar phosphate isomerase/epimerase